MPITMTPAAIEEAEKKLSEQPQGTFIRFSIKGGGCSGLSYELRFDSVFTPAYDLEFICDGVKIVVDKKSYIYVNGTEIDFVEENLQKGFRARNPNVKEGNTCGCGQSFHPGTAQ